MALLTTTSEAAIAGLEEQILAKAVILYPDPVTSLRGSIFSCARNDVPHNEAFHVAVGMEPSSTTTFDRSEHPYGYLTRNDALKQRYVAVLIRIMNGHTTDIKMGDVKDSAADTLRSLLDMLVRDLSRASSVRHMERIKLFGSRPSQACWDDGRRLRLDDQQGTTQSLAMASGSLVMSE